MRREHLALLFLALATLACNLRPGIPVTPTVRPTLIPSLVPTFTAVALLPTDTPPPTYTPSNTPIPTETEIPSDTPEASLTPTFTQTRTPTATPTLTFTASPTETSTPTLSATPSQTATPRPTNTLVPSPTISETPRPTDTPNPSATPTNTPTPLPPSDTPTPTLIPVITATTPPLPPVATAVAAIPTAVPSQPAPTPTAPPSTARPVPPNSATPIVIAAVPTAAPVQSANVGNNVLLAPLRDYAGRPAKNYDISITGHRAIVSQDGTMTIDNVLYNAGGKHSTQRFVTARWSPDGRWLAYVIETPNAESGQLGWQGTIDDGLWILDMANSAAPPQFILRNHYDLPYDKALNVALSINWAPDNDAILVAVKYPGGLGTKFVGKSTRVDESDQPDRFPLLNYVGATWLADSSGFVTASVTPGRGPIVGFVNRNLQFTPIADGATLQLWMQNPAQLADGRYGFLGKPAPNGLGDSNGLSMYIMSQGGAPVQISQTLQGDVISAEWSPTRSALLVVRRYDGRIVVNAIALNGQILDYSGLADGSPAIHWWH